MTNILFIITDTQRRDRLSLYGHSRPTSPRLDAFAQSASVYERAIAPAQWTIPAHASFFTGEYPVRHGMVQANHILSEQYATLAELLHLHGYHTVGFCNNPLVGILKNGFQRGFAEFYNYAGTAPNRASDRLYSGLAGTLQRDYRALTRAINNRFAHDDALFRLSLSPLMTRLWSNTVNYKGSTPLSTRDLGDYWHRHVTTSDQPIFAFLNLMGTHMPLKPTSTALDRMNPSVRRSRAGLRWMNEYNQHGLAWISPADAPLTDWQADTLATFYDAESAMQDEALGAMLAQLDAQGDLDNTLVIVGADHGEGLGDHGFFGHSFVVYHELVHVPWLMRYPERLPAARVNTNISTRRVYHTILDVAGVPAALLPENDNHNIAALSLAQPLSPHTDSEANTVFSEAQPSRTLLSVLERRQSPHLTSLALQEVRRAVLRGDDKLVMVGERVEGLYHLPSDPTECHDRQYDDPATVVALREALAAYAGMDTTSSPETDFSPAVLANLRALGYVE